MKNHQENKGKTIMETNGKPLGIPNGKLFDAIRVHAWMDVKIYLNLTRPYHLHASLCSVLLFRGGTIPVEL